MTYNQTPLPWTYQIEFDQTFSIIPTDRPGYICRMGVTIEDGINCMFIIRACNTHPDLVAALQKLSAHINRDKNTHINWAWIDDILRKAEGYEI